MKKQSRSALIFKREAPGICPVGPMVHPALPTCPATSYNFVRIFCNDSEAIFSRISSLYPGDQIFLSEKHLKESANHTVFI